MSKEIRQMIDKVKNFKQSINENIEQNNVKIEIKKSDSDERSNKKQPNKFHVNYQINVNGKLIEIEGSLNPYHTGRSEEYNFEPDYFMDNETEQYYDNNWEKIQDEILNQFNKMNF